MFAWRDSNVVLFATTVGNLGETVTRNRRRPGASRTGAAQTRKVFGNNVRLPLDIPSLINNYNHFMGGVDQFDQLRSYYSILRPHYKTWRPLFTLLIEISLVNCYKLATANRKTTHDAHRNWLLTLVVQLKALAVRKLKRKRSPPRSHQGLHELQRLYPKQRNCVACADRGRRSTPRAPLSEISSSTNYIRPRRPQRTYWGCKQCDKPLCKPPLSLCWSEYVKTAQLSSLYLQNR